MRTACEVFLGQARALRSAFPDAAAMFGLPVGPLPDVVGRPELRAALRYLWEEMVLVRNGGANGVGVLDDEIAHVERELARL